MVIFKNQRCGVVKLSPYQVRQTPDRRETIGFFDSQTGRAALLGRTACFFIFPRFAAAPAYRGRLPRRQSFCFFIPLYSYRSASMGSSLAALLAG